MGGGQIVIKCIVEILKLINDWKCFNNYTESNTVN